MIRKNIKDSKGVVAIILGIAFPLIIGFLALGIDLAHIRLKNDYYQTISDAVAIDLGHDIASMCNSEVCSLSYLQNDAQIEAEKMGCKGSECKLSIIWPYQNDERQVKVQILNGQQAFFVSNFFNNNVKAVVSQNLSLTNNGENFGSGCILALNSLTGYDVNIPNKKCETIGNQSVSITNTSIINGILTSSGNISVSEDSKANYTNPYQQAVVNSYSNNIAISSNSENSLSCLDSSGPITSTDLSPGRYCNIVDIENSYVKFEPGLYFFDKGLSANKVTVSGNNVTFVFAPSSIVDLENSTFNLTAPNSSSSGQPGMVMMQMADDTSESSYVFNTVNLTFTGAVYFPTKDISFVNGAIASVDNENGCGQIIGSNISMKNNKIDLGNMCSDSIGVRAFGTQKTGWISSNMNSSDMTTAHPILTE